MNEALRKLLYDTREKLRTHTHKPQGMHVHDYASTFHVHSSAELFSILKSTLRYWFALRQHVHDYASPLHTHDYNLAYNATTVTTGNVTAVSGNHYDLTIAGMTADRDFNLPTPSRAGKIISLRVLDGDATYELIIKANSVEITRVFIADETLVLMSTGTGAGDWKILENGLLPSIGGQRASVAQTGLVHSVATKITLGTSTVSVGDINDTSNDRVVVRRDGEYALYGKIPYANNANNSPSAHAQIWKGGGVVSGVFLPNSAGEYVGVSTNDTLSLAVGDYIELYGQQYSGINRNLYYSAAQAAWAQLIVTEVL